MTEILIQQWHRQFQLGTLGREQLPEMDHAVQQAVVDFLPDAVATLQLGDQEELCIRRLQVPLRYRLDQSATSSARHWSQLIATAIKEAMRDGNQVLRFANRRAGLVAFACATAGNDQSSAWAWNQMGLAQMSQAPSHQEAKQQLVLALLNRPEQILLVLRQLIRVELCIPLLQQLSNAQIESLVHCWVSFAGLTTLPPLADLEFQIDEVCEDNSSELIRLTQRAEQILNASPLMAQLIANSAPLPGRPLSWSHWSVLLVMTSDPSLFLLPADLQRALFARVAQRSAARCHRQTFTQASSNGENSDHFALSNRRQATQNKHFESVSLSWQQAFDSADQDRRARANPSIPELPGSFKESHGNRVEAALTATHAGPDSQSEWPAAPNLVSDYAGLFLLLPLLKELNLVPSLLRATTSPARPVHWWLRFIAQDLVAVSDRDPALKLFCGIDAGAEWPDLPAVANNSQEQAIITASSAQLRQGLVECLSWQCPPDEFPLRLCCRQGRLQDEGGWLEIYFDQRDLDTEIRRAGLDLNPDFVPWLGRVVRFRYE